MMVLNKREKMFSFDRTGRDGLRGLDTWSLLHRALEPGSTGWCPRLASSPRPRRGGGASLERSLHWKLRKSPKLLATLSWSGDAW